LLEVLLGAQLDRLVLLEHLVPLVRLEVLVLMEQVVLELLVLMEQVVPVEHLEVLGLEALGLEVVGLGMLDLEVLDLEALVALMVFMALTVYMDLMVLPALIQHQQIVFSTDPLDWLLTTLIRYCMLSTVKIMLLRPLTSQLLVTRLLQLPKVLCWMAHLELFTHRQISTSQASMEMPFSRFRLLAPTQCP
jgi:hypothetical protein